MQTLSSGHPLSRVTDFGSGSVLPLRSGEPEADGTGDRKTVRCHSIGSCMILMQTLRSGDPLSRVTDFGSGSVLPLRSGEPAADGTGARKTVRCPSIGSCMILMQTLSSGDPLSRVTDFGFGSVLPLRSGEPEADGTSDRKTVRCPSIGSCMILMQTLSSGDPLCGLLFGGLVSRVLLSRATDFGSDRADACP